MNFIFVGVAVIFGEFHGAVVHQHRQGSPSLYIVPLFHVYLGDGSGKGGGNRQVCQGFLEVGEVFLIILQRLLELGDLIFVPADEFIQLRVVLFIEQVPGLHGVSGLHVDRSNLCGGGHGDRLAVPGEGDAGARDGGGETPGGQGLGEHLQLLLLKEEGVNAKGRPGQHSQRHERSQHPFYREGPAAGFCRGWGNGRAGRGREFQFHRISLLFQFRPPV